MMFVYQEDLFIQLLQIKGDDIDTNFKRKRVFVKKYSVEKDISYQDCPENMKFITNISKCVCGILNIYIIIMIILL